MSSPYRPPPEQKMRTRCVYCDEILDPHKRVLVREREDGTTLWCCSTGECLARFHRERGDPPP